jgi:hypothetical protein
VEPLPQEISRDSRGAAWVEIVNRVQGPLRWQMYLCPSRPTTFVPGESSTHAQRPTYLPTLVGSALHLLRNSSLSFPLFPSCLYHGTEHIVLECPPCLFGFFHHDRLLAMGAVIKKHKLPHIQKEQLQVGKDLEACAHTCHWPRALQVHACVLCYY